MKHKKYGFTLIELLVVIAIIALLAAILLPSLAIAKRKADIVKQHPDYSHEQVSALMKLRSKDPNAELSGGAAQVTTPTATSPTPKGNPEFNGVVVDKMVIKDALGHKSPTVVVVETNYYTVSDEDYRRAMVGSKPYFNKP